MGAQIGDPRKRKVLVMSSPAAGVGVDGCRTGWVWVRATRAHFTTGIAASLEEIVARFPGERVLVDIPIGLPSDTRPRGCEAPARRFIGPRRASVFTPPGRAAIAAPDYASANLANRKQTGRGLSKQAWNLVPKIREADRLLRADPELTTRVHESHPEVCFRGLSKAPLAHYKKTREGRSERLAVLGNLRPGLELRLADFLTARHPGSAADDLLDAFVLALTAALPLGRLATFPSPPERDAFGLPMQIVLPQPARIDPSLKGSLGTLE